MQSLKFNILSIINIINYKLKILCHILQVNERGSHPRSMIKFSTGDIE